MYCSLTGCIVLIHQPVQRQVCAINLLAYLRDCRSGQVPLFQDVPVDFMRQLCMHVVRFIFSPGEIIIYSDEPVHEIYVVHRGICQVLLLQAHLPIIDQLMGVVSERPNP